MEYKEEYSEQMQQMEANSLFKSKLIQKRKLMTVQEMGNLLGLKKTERYWLVHIFFGGMIILYVQYCILQML